MKTESSSSGRRTSKSIISSSRRRSSDSRRHCRFLRDFGLSFLANIHQEASLHGSSEHNVFGQIVGIMVVRVLGTAGGERRMRTNSHSRRISSTAARL